jgi:CHASE2 domain-containing sensor protein
VVAKGTEAGIADVNLQGSRRFLVPRTILEDNKIEKLPYDPKFNRLAFLEIDIGGDERRLINRTALAGNKHPLQKFRKDFDKSKFTVLRTPRIRAATDRQGRIWPYFSKSDTSKYVSAKDIIAAFDEKGKFTGSVELKKIQGKLALLGTSATGLLDIKTVPTERFIPGVEVHAQLIESVLTNQFLNRPEFVDAAEMGIALIAGLIMIILVPWVGARWA